MTDFTAARKFWEKKILGWEFWRYSPLLWFYPPSWPIRWRLSKAARMFSQLAPAPASVYEIGCGGGYFAARLPAGVRYLGIDIAESAVAAATLRAPGCKFRQGNALALPGENFELTVFLGLTDWLEPEELRMLFASLSSRDLIFSYTEKRVLPSWHPYRWYRRIIDKNAPRTGYKANSYDWDYINGLLVSGGYRVVEKTPDSWFNPGVLVSARKAS